MRAPLSPDAGSPAKRKEAPYQTRRSPADHARKQQSRTPRFIVTPGSPTAFELRLLGSSAATT